MVKINDTTTFPITTPAADDLLLGTDVSDTGNDPNGETVNFKLQDLKDEIFTSKILSGNGPHTNLDNITSLAIIATLATSDSSDNSGSASAQYRTSSDNGSTWGSWTTIVSVSTFGSSTSPRSDFFPVTQFVNMTSANAIQLQSTGSGGTTASLNGAVLIGF